jgi:two-component system response regulator MtrA
MDSTNKGRVLIVDDEPSIVLALTGELRFEGFEVKSVADGLAAVSTALEWKPDVILLDVMLPGSNGFEVCRELRPKAPGVWIILLTARGHEGDRVRGFESGADDYVVKPFSLREVVARVRVGLRRRQSPPPRDRYTFGDITVDLGTRTVTRAGQEITLTRKEFDILQLLIQRAGDVVDRDHFCEAVWGEVNVTERVIDAHVFGLRRKLEPDADKPRLILSVRGIGYKLGAI